MSNVATQFTPGKSGNPVGRPIGSIKKDIYNVAKSLSTMELIDKDGNRTKGFDPFYELAMLGKFAKSEKVRCEACSELAHYVAPKLKHIEHSGDKDASLSVFLNFGGVQNTLEKVVEKIIETDEVE